MPLDAFVTRRRIARIAAGAGSPARAAAWRMAAILACFLLLSLPIATLGRPEIAGIGARAEPPAFAIVGDSRAHVGLSPALLAEAFAGAGLGDRGGYNFAADGTNVLNHRSLVVSGLLGEARVPPLVIWAPSPLSFDATRGGDHLDHLRAADLPALLRAGAPTEVILDLATMMALPAYRGRPGVKAEIERVVDGAGARLTRAHARLFGLQFAPPANGRAYLSPRDGYRPFRVVTAWEERFARGAEKYAALYEKLELAPSGLALARDLAARVREAGALLVVVELPIAPFLQRAYATRPQHRAWQAALQRIAALEGAIWISDADRFDDDRLFGDPAHMHVETAERYSRALAEELLAEPRVRAALARGQERR